MIQSLSNWPTVDRFHGLLLQFTHRSTFCRITSANRLGVQLNEAELECWTSIVTTTSEGADVVMDERTGVTGITPAQRTALIALGAVEE